MLLKDAVSRIVVSKENSSNFANDFIRECKAAKTVQQNWGQTTKQVCGTKTFPSICTHESTYMLTHAAYSALRNCEFLQKKARAKHLSEQEIIDTLNNEVNPCANITSYILVN